jgi:hypothetical protein
MDGDNLSQGGDPAARQALDEKCWPIFEKLTHELGDRYLNWLVAIEPESGEYFLGQDDLDVLSRARKKYPGGTFFAYRLGKNPAVDYLC